MNFSESLIIYLACGAPFGVEYLQRRTDRSVFATAFGVVIRFLLWPISAGRMLFRLLARSSELLLDPSETTDQRLAAIRSKLEAIIHAEHGPPRVFEFRDTFLRYTGLARSGSAEPGRGVAEIFEVTRHGDVSLATTCLNRKNARKLGRHRDRARDEFANIISSIASPDEMPDEVVRLAFETADAVSDKQLAAKLAGTYGQAAMPWLAADDRSKGELWSTGSQHHSIAN
ncbi:MAG: hypothetical protein K1X36_12610 [Pyrinomonadaceae bacterium]|nr:hypothetical protein [Pyrinomonadaceae bacterium]